uniref:Ionotropic glutamate receptor C-terminal domain-containing protein n=1 Tax=Chenopodium quinoa TaxID=63459 RepID=A0A803MDU6_CHEQI
VFVDPNARTGKEQTVGIEIAAEDFNKSPNNKVELHFRNSSRSNPLQTAYSAIELIKEKKIEAIITGTENSEEVALMEEIANQYQVPVLSLAAASLRSSSQVEKHSFLVQLTNDYSLQINCTAMLVQNFGWKKVIAVYEDGEDLSTISSMLDLFSKELQGVGSEIEHLLALPPVGSVPYSKELIEELAKVFSMQSRVFVVLDSSLPMAIQLFKEANNMGLMGRETAWIVTDRIASLLDALNSSTRSYMEGTLGIKTYYDDNSQDFMDFSRAFLLKMIAKYPNEQNFHPGIHALRAYDAITTIGYAFERKKRQDYNISHALMHEILSSKFTGSSGKISIKNGALDEDVILYRIVNVVGKSYKELDFWSPKIGFVEKLREEDHKENSSEILNKMLNGIVNWPGDIKHNVPIGYTMPSTMKPLKIGIPGNPPFDKFVMVETLNKNKTTYTGFCIDVFLEVVKIVEESYGLPYEFEVFNGTYDELIYRVHDKTYDAAVGDITILANRSNFVEFTQPYTKSGLSMIVPLKSKDSHKAKMLIKPFSWKLWGEHTEQFNTPTGGSMDVCGVCNDIKLYGKPNSNAHGSIVRAN